MQHIFKKKQIWYWKKKTIKLILFFLNFILVHSKLGSSENVSD